MDHWCFLGIIWYILFNIDSVILRSWNLCWKNYIFFIGSGHISTFGQQSTGRGSGSGVTSSTHNSFGRPSTVPTFGGVTQSTLGIGTAVTGSNSGIYSTQSGLEGKPKGPPAGYPFLDLTTLSPSGGRVKPYAETISYEPGKDCGVRREVGTRVRWKKVFAYLSTTAFKYFSSRFLVQTDLTDWKQVLVNFHGRHKFFCPPTKVAFAAEQFFQPP